MKASVAKAFDKAFKAILSLQVSRNLFFVDGFCLKVNIISLLNACPLGKLEEEYASRPETTFCCFHRLSFRCVDAFTFCAANKKHFL